MPLKASRRGKDEVYRIRGVHHGVRVDKSARTRSLKQAKEIAETWERQIYEEHVLGRAAPLTFAELAVRYQESGKNLGRLAVEIITAWADKPINKITSADAHALAAEIYPGRADSSQNRVVIAPISAIMHFAADNDLAPLRKWRLIKTSRPRDAKTDWRRPAEIETILSAMTKDETRALAALYVGCGLRASEGIWIDTRELSPGLTSLRVLGTARAASATLGHHGTKSGRDRSVDIPPRAAELLRPVLQTEPGFALLSSRGQPWRGRDALDKTLRAACNRAGVAPLGAHALRHTFATWHNAVHGDPVQLMSQGGWSSLSLVARYAHAADKELGREVIATGWAILGQSDERFKDIPNRYKVLAA